MTRVFVTRRLTGPALAELEAKVDVWDGELPPPPSALRERASEADGLLTLLSDRVDVELLDACPQLRVISNYAVGTDNIDLAACRERGIAVGRTPDVLTDATADLTWALILAVVRRLPEAANAVASGRWHTWEPAKWLGSGLGGRDLLVVGPGRIGHAVARRGKAFGMQVKYAGRDDPLHAMLAEADIVTLHLPLNVYTRRIIDEEALAAMREGAVLINTARGGLVNQPALAEALRSGHLAGAGLDVTDPEPLPPDDPLLRSPNLLVLPHIGSATLEARTAMTRRCVENLRAGLAREPLPYPA
jgi:glyoxylate reductase